MDINIKCPQSFDRGTADPILRETISSALTTQTDIVFKYTESPGDKVEVSLPKMNGELRISDFELAKRVFEQVCRLVPHGPIECGTKGTGNGASRPW
jgi:hypothetical protein